MSVSAGLLSRSLPRGPCHRSLLSIFPPYGARTDSSPLLRCTSGPPPFLFCHDPSRNRNRFTLFPFPSDDRFPPPLFCCTLLEFSERRLLCNAYRNPQLSAFGPFFPPTMLKTFLLFFRDPLLYPPACRRFMEQRDAFSSMPRRCFQSPFFPSSLFPHALRVAVFSLQPSFYLWWKT